jgi:xylose isomerase
MDVGARGLLIAAKMIEDGALARHVKERYAAWDSPDGKAILSGEQSLADLAAKVEARNAEPQPRSGKQEYLENLVNSYV